MRSDGYHDGGAGWCSFCDEWDSVCGCTEYLEVTLKKIPTIFVRDSANPKLVTRERTPDCQWVFDGEGVATRKTDGTACLIRDGRLYKRLEWKEGKGDAPPEWLHHDFDPNIRHGHGWIPVGIGPDDWMHRDVQWKHLAPGTYELVGPKIGKNPERAESLTLTRHGDVCYPDAPRDFDGLSTWLAEHEIEGLVWHHQDGRMAKIKARDFGIRWPRPLETK